MEPPCINKDFHLLHSFINSTMVNLNIFITAIKAGWVKTITNSDKKRAGSIIIYKSNLEKKWKLNI